VSSLEPGGFLEFLEHGHGGGGRVVPHVGAQAREHHGADGRAGLSESLDGLRHLFGRFGGAGAVVRDDGHVADLHDEVRCERGQQFGILLRRSA
jgi:hypothetical protein